MEGVSHAPLLGAHTTCWPGACVTAPPHSNMLEINWGVSRLERGAACLPWHLARCALASLDWSQPPTIFADPWLPGPHRGEQHPHGNHTVCGTAASRAGHMNSGHVTNHSCTLWIPATAWAMAFRVTSRDCSHRVILFSASLQHHLPYSMSTENYHALHIRPGCAVRRSPLPDAPACS